MARTLDIKPNDVLSSVVKNYCNGYDDYYNNCYNCVKRVSEDINPYCVLPQLSNDELDECVKTGLIVVTTELVKTSSYNRVNNKQESKTGDIGLLYNNKGLLCFAICIDTDKWAAKSQDGFTLLPDKNIVRFYRCQQQLEL